MFNQIEIIQQVIDSAPHTLSVTSVVQNSPGNYTIYACNTYYLNIGKKFTVSGVIYTVISFVINESVTVTGASIPAAADFNIPSPKFVYGTPKFVNIELAKRNDKYPYIWLVEITNTENDSSPSARIKSTPNFSLLFLDCTDKTRWTIADHYANAIDPMANEIEYFIRVIKRRRDLFETEDLVYETVSHANFGEYITNKGYDSKIISDDVSGKQLQLRLPFIVNSCECGPVEIFNMPGQFVFQLNGVTIYEKTSTNMNAENFDIIA